jgi:NADH-quinone oxidoreductase subunit J
MSLFLFLSFVALLSALGVVLAKNPVHSVLFLILTFFTLSAHYLMLNAQFLAAVNIIVYAGAIMVLFLFVIMFLNLNEDTEPHKPMLAKIAATIAGGVRCCSSWWQPCIACSLLAMTQILSIRRWAW